MFEARHLDTSAPKDCEAVASRGFAFEPTRGRTGAIRITLAWLAAPFVPGVIACATVLTLGLSAASAQSQIAPAQSHSFGVTPVRAIPQGRIVAAPRGAARLCVTYSWACTHSGRNTQITRSQLNEAARINQRVNRSVREISDLHQYGREDVWSLPSASGGDCEDFALLKKRELIQAGFPPERLLLATVLDRKRQGHAVLVLNTDQGYYVLDNLTNEVKRWERTGYTFIRMQNPNAPSTWVSVFAGGILTS